MFIQPIDYILAIWFALVAASTAYVAWDQFRNNPEPVVMKWGFILVTLYLGPFGALLYVLADKEPKPGTHEEFIKPLWKQGLGSSIHCVAGDATGIIVAAVIVALLGLPMWLDLIIEYVAGFAFGLFIFQSLFMKQMMGGSYWENVRRSFLPEFISMNFMMAGMAMVMSFLMMGRDMRAMEPTELVFWGVMSLGVMAGLASCYPSNVWMVARGLKHGLMTKRSEDDPLASEHDGVHSASRSHSDHASEAGASGHEESAAVAPHVGEHADAPPAEDSKSGHEHAHGAAGIPAVARLGRHPLHPMLVTLPIGLFVAALIGDVGYWGSGNSDWATATAWLIAGGLLTGLIASAAGLTDFIGNPEIGALYHARYHLIGNLSLLAVAAVSLGLRIWIGPEQAVLPWGLLASAIVVGLLVFTGWHGGEMVFGHGVGMTPHKHGSSGQTSHTAHAKSPPVGHQSAQHEHQHAGGQTMTSGATVPQLVAISSVSVLVLLVGLGAPANWVNMTLSARDTEGAIMPPGMIMTRDTPAAAMLDMAAVRPRDVSARLDLSAKGDTELKPRLEGGVKVFDLTASVITWTILAGQTVDGYAFNDQVPGPRLHLTEGDRVRIVVHNRLPETTTVHWHGLIVPNAMDGPANITQQPIPVGGDFTYEFTASQAGTYFYHSHDHSDRQQALGLYGALIIDPKQPDPSLAATYDYSVQLQEWLTREGLTYPAMPMEGGMPNFFTINGRSYPATDTVRMKVGETIRLRFIGSNNGFIHPMHVHGGPFEVVAIDGQTLAPSARFQADTVNIAPGQRYDVIWTARAPGKWLVHCHIPHHTTNNNAEEDGGGGLMMIIDVGAV